MPISLLVSLELVKFAQALFMSCDITMYDEEEDIQMAAQSSNLNEELGQIHYVFSDKTGTLTCNIMEFKKFSAGSRGYGTGQKPMAPQLSNVNFHDDALLDDLLNSSRPNHAALLRVVLFLAACHTIIIDEKKGTYTSSSPDELALVNAAKQFGYEFKGRDADDTVVIRDCHRNEDLCYQLLNVCEFTSARKRMSCIFRDPKGRLVLMCKGADTVITERLTPASRASDLFTQTETVVNGYAEEGLRTLYLAEKFLDEKEYASWSQEARQARLALENREEIVAAADEKIEAGLELIGSTAIEDRLQDEVADTIKFMREAGIKVWVLTGDKIETAINIGLSAGLLDQQMQIHVIEEVEAAGLRQRLVDVNEEISTSNALNKGKHAVVVAGAALVKIDEEPALRKEFLDGALQVEVVLACRVSPK